MDNRVKSLWVDALLSGKYRQGRSRLRRDDKFCCLGVLCDLYIQEHPDKASWDRDGSLSYGDDYTREDEVLPPPVSQWAGIIGDNPMIGGFNDESICATVANDDLQYNFKNIADLIKNMNTNNPYEVINNE